MHNFYQLYYHFVWGTKNKEPLITADIEKLLINYIPAKAKKLNCIHHQVGMVDNHIHLAATVPPNISLSSFIQEIKGGSTHLINQSILDLDYRFQWQNGYGVISFSKKTLPVIKKYIAQQKQHHQDNTLIEVLEET